MSILPCFKSHYSLGKSILTLDKPKDNLDIYPLSIFSIAKFHKLDTICLVEDSISGLLEASKNAKDNNIKLLFGLRLSVTDDVTVKNDDSHLKQSKYIIFCKNPDGYKDLIKISSFASTDGFYYEPRIDFTNLKRLWTKNLLLCVPFYDSFLHLNTLEGRNHVPNFSFTKPVFFLEDNSLPFDYLIKNKVLNFCEKNGFETLNTQSIYYYSPDDYKAYVCFRAINSRGFSKKATCESPNINHLCSDTFNFLRTI
jgi:DNA polymerase-3 subunit alpha